MLMLPKFTKTEDGRYINLNMIECFCVEKNERDRIFVVKAITDCYTYILRHFSYGYNLEDDTEKVAEMKANLWLQRFMGDSDNAD